MTKTTKIVLAVALLAIIIPQPADAAWCWWNRCKKSKQGPVATVPAPVPTPVPTPTPTPKPTPVPAPTPTPTGSETVLSAWVTAYTYYDNDPPGSATISDPIIHKVAGGTGTYQDPITLAVGYTSAGPDIKPGTRFYIPAVQRYFIVEDTCASCHKGYQGSLWIDMWIDGSKTTASKADSCASALTDIHNVIQNPKSTYPVTAGVLSGLTCSPLFGEVLKLLP